MFKTIPVYPHYEVDANSNVRGKRSGVVLKTKMHLGYRHVGLYVGGGKYRHHNVHRLAAMAWLPMPSEYLKMDVAHNDGSRTNNHISNLRWATKKQNAADRAAHGRTRGAHPGDGHHNRRLSSEVVAYLRREARRGVKFGELAVTMGVPKITVYDAITGRTWRTVDNVESPVVIKRGVVS